MITLPSSILEELHKLASDGAMLYLLEIPEHGIRLARNTEDVRWCGEVYQKSWFEIESLQESGTGDNPELWVQASNIGGFLEAEIIAHNNFEDSTCVISIVNANCLDETEPIFSLTLDIMKPACDHKVASLKLSCENPLLLAYPAWKFHQNLCQYAEFKGDLCGYTGVDASCLRTLADCMSKSNQERFGGQLSLIGTFIDV
jgi:phage-related protein